MIKKITSWFKIKKFKEPNRNVCAIYNKFFRVIKNSKGIYFYEFADFSSLEYREFYKGKKVKFLNKYAMYIITIVFNIIIIPILFILYFPMCYFDGAKNFIKDTAWYENVKFFNWVNFILSIVYLIYFIIF